jgi:hypothetical protein
VAGRRDAKLEQRQIEHDAGIERRFAEQDAKFAKRFAAIDGRVAALETSLEKRFGEINTRFATKEATVERTLKEHTRWMVGARQLRVTASWRYAAMPSPRARDRFTCTVRLSSRRSIVCRIRDLATVVTLSTFSCEGERRPLASPSTSR